VRLISFDIPTLIATISSSITLEPGDVIATRTPPGVGIGSDQPRFLTPGRPGQGLRRRDRHAPEPGQVAMHEEGAWLGSR